MSIFTLAYCSFAADFSKSLVIVLRAYLPAKHKILNILMCEVISCYMTFEVKIHKLFLSMLVGSKLVFFVYFRHVKLKLEALHTMKKKLNYPGQTN